MQDLKQVHEFPWCRYWTSCKVLPSGQCFELFFASVKRGSLGLKRSELSGKLHQVYLIPGWFWLLQSQLAFFPSATKHVSAAEVVSLASSARS